MQGSQDLTLLMQCNMLRSHGLQLVPMTITAICSLTQLSCDARQDTAQKNTQQVPIAVVLRLLHLAGVSRRQTLLLLKVEQRALAAGASAPARLTGTACRKASKIVAPRPLEPFRLVRNAAAAGSTSLASGEWKRKGDRLYKLKIYKSSA
jgi:hypothetical protein